LSSIILVRHGPVAYKTTGLLSFAAFRAYIDAYELSGVEAGARPPERTAQLLSGASTVFASDAPRVFDTLARLGVEATVADAEFREAPPLAPHLPLRLPAVAWLALARVRGEFDPALAPARDDLRRRAGNCAGRLIEASAQGDVALVGHGWFNRYVARALAGRGRRKTSGSGFHRPWGYLIFR
jgi:broad specificity phosphatase PhoE